MCPRHGAGTLHVDLSGITCRLRVETEKSDLPLGGSTPKLSAPVFVPVSLTCVWELKSRSAQKALPVYSPPPLVLTRHTARVAMSSRLIKDPWSGSSGT